MPWLSPSLAWLSRRRPGFWEITGQPACRSHLPPKPTCFPSPRPAPAQPLGPGRGQAPGDKGSMSRHRQLAREAVLPNIEDTAVVSPRCHPVCGQLCPYLCPGTPDSKAIDKKKDAG